MMETHGLIGAEHMLTASSRIQAAVHDFSRAVESLQLENLRHEEQMRQIVADFSEVVTRMNPYLGMPR